MKLIIWQIDTSIDYKSQTTQQWVSSGNCSAATSSLSPQPKTKSPNSQSRANKKLLSWPGSAPPNPSPSTSKPRIWNPWPLKTPLIASLLYRLRFITKTKSPSACPSPMTGTSSRKRNSKASWSTFSKPKSAKSKTSLAPMGFTAWSTATSLYWV